MVSAAMTFFSAAIEYSLTMTAFHDSSREAIRIVQKVASLTFVPFCKGNLRELWNSHN